MTKYHGGRVHPYFGLKGINQYYCGRKTKSEEVVEKDPEPFSEIRLIAVGNFVWKKRSKNG